LTVAKQTPVWKLTPAPSGDCIGRAPNRYVMQLMKRTPLAQRGTADGKVEQKGSKNLLAQRASLSTFDSAVAEFLLMMWKLN